MDATTTTLSLKRDLLTGTEWNPAQLRDFFRLASAMKAHPEQYRSALAGSVFVLIFEKPSLRTRVTFEVGIAKLGGSSVFLDHTAARLGERESDSRRREEPRALGAGHRRARFRADDVSKRWRPTCEYSGDQCALG